MINTAFVVLICAFTLWVLFLAFSEARELYVSFRDGVDKPPRFEFVPDEEHGEFKSLEPAEKDGARAFAKVKREDFERELSRALATYVELEPDNPRIARNQERVRLLLEALEETDVYLNTSGA